jgi:hypothetical protein
MRKWITAACAILVIAVLVMLRSEVLSPGESMAAAAPKALRSASPPAVPAPAAIAPAPTPAPAPEAPQPPKKLDPQSDAFFYKFDEVVPARLTRAAATCYEGARHVHRNQKLKLGFKTHIVDGEVTVVDVKVLESTLDYPGLEACFIREVSAVHWHDDALPNWEQDDQLVLRPERGMKKFMRENMEYEGDGEIGPAIRQPGQAPATSDTAQASHGDEW